MAAHTQYTVHLVRNILDARDVPREAAQSRARRFNIPCCSNCKPGYCTAPVGTSLHGLSGLLMCVWLVCMWQAHRLPSPPARHAHMPLPVPVWEQNWHCMYDGSRRLANMCFRRENSLASTSQPAPSRFHAHARCHQRTTGCILLDLFWSDCASSRAGAARLGPQAVRRLHRQTFQIAVSRRVVTGQWWLSVVGGGSTGPASDHQQALTGHSS